MKKILFMFLCLQLISHLHAQSSYSSANQDTETNTELKKENDPNDINRDISSEEDKEKAERKMEQDNYEPENISEEDENL